MNIAEVGHLQDVKHDKDMCFTCDDIENDRYRATQSRFKRVSGSLGVLLLIASIGLITGYILALYLSVNLYSQIM